MFVITAKIRKEVQTKMGSVEKDIRYYIGKGEGCRATSKIGDAHLFRTKESAQKYHKKHQLADKWQIRATRKKEVH